MNVGFCQEVEEVTLYLCGGGWLEKEREWEEEEEEEEEEDEEEERNKQWRESKKKVR